MPRNLPVGGQLSAPPGRHSQLTQPTPQPPPAGALVLRKTGPLSPAPSFCPNEGRQGFHRAEPDPHHRPSPGPLRRAWLLTEPSPWVPRPALHRGIQLQPEPMETRLRQVRDMACGDHGTDHARCDHRTIKCRGLVQKSHPSLLLSLCPRGQRHQLPTEKGQLCPRPKRLTQGTPRRGRRLGNPVRIEAEAQPQGLLGPHLRPRPAQGSWLRAQSLGASPTLWSHRHTRHMHMHTRSDTHIYTETLRTGVCWWTHTHCPPLPHAARAPVDTRARWPDTTQEMLQWLPPGRPASPSRPAHPLPTPGPLLPKSGPLSEVMATAPSADTRSSGPAVFPLFHLSAHGN